METDRMDPVIERIRELFRGEASGHDLWHTMRVYRCAMCIAEHYDCDKTVVALAALLHDADDEKLFSTRDHENARRVMREAQIPEEQAEKVIRVIRQVSFRGRDTVTPDTLEGQIVQDADRLDAIGAVGIARAFAFGGSRGRRMHEPGEAPRMDLDRESMKHYEGTTVNHFYEKLFLLKTMMNTQEASRIAEERDRFMRAFLNEFYAEWEGEK